MSDTPEYPDNPHERLCTPAGRPAGGALVPPALIMGLGGTGHAVLAEVRRGLVDRFGDLDQALPGLRFMFLDTDRGEVERAEAEATDPHWVDLPRDAKGCLALSHDSLLRLRGDREHLPLLQWLPPEAVPTSMDHGTSGVRALGRLALSWHVAEVRERLARAARALAEPPMRAGGVPAGPQRPMVYLVGSLNGGTGSGMFIDLAFLAAEVFRQIVGAGCLVGMFLGPPDDGSNPGCLASASAALRELNHWNRSDTVFSAEYGVLAPTYCLADERSGPFEYFFLLEPRFGRGSRAGGDLIRLLGQALLCDLLSGTAATTAALGSSADERLAAVDPRGNPCRYQTLGLAELCFPKGKVRRACAYRLVSEVLTEWLNGAGAYSSGQAHTATPHDRLERELHSRGLDKPSLLKAVRPQGEAGERIDSAEHFLGGLQQEVHLAEAWEGDVVELLRDALDRQQQRLFGEPDSASCPVLERPSEGRGELLRDVQQRAHQLMHGLEPLSSLPALGALGDLLTAWTERMGLTGALEPLRYLSDYYQSVAVEWRGEHAQTLAHRDQLAIQSENILRRVRSTAGAPAMLRALGGRVRLRTQVAEYLACASALLATQLDGHVYEYGAAVAEALAHEVGRARERRVRAGEATQRAAAECRSVSEQVRTTTPAWFVTEIGDDAVIEGIYRSVVTAELRHVMSARLVAAAHGHEVYHAASMLANGEPRFAVLKTLFEEALAPFTKADVLDLLFTQYGPEARAVVAHLVQQVSEPQLWQDRPAAPGVAAAGEETLTVAVSGGDHPDTTAQTDFVDLCRDAARQLSLPLQTVPLPETETVFLRRERAGFPLTAVALMQPGRVGQPEVAAAHSRRDVDWRPLFAAAPANSQTTAPEANGAASAQLPEVSLDRVQFSVTAPQTVVPGQSYVMDVWAYLQEQRQEALARALEEASAALRIKSQGPVQVQRGTFLVVRLALKGMRIEPAENTILWDGVIGNASFAVTVPQDATPGQSLGRVTVLVNGLEVAVIAFTQDIGSSTAATAAPLRTTTQRFRKAFASYASEDNDDVLGRIQGMQIAAPVDVFFAEANLHSGENWQARLEEEILSRDVLYLFWSQAASKSWWVDWEWRLGLEKRGLSFIGPVPLVHPRLVPPPKELADKLHFNDWVLAFMRGRGADPSELPASGDAPPPVS